MFLREKWGTLQSPWEQFSCVVVVHLTLLLVFLNVSGNPVHPLLAALLGSFGLLKHFLHQAASLRRGCIALDIVWTTRLRGWGH